MNCAQVVMIEISNSAKFPGIDGKFKLSFYRITEDRRGGNSFDQPPHEADVAEAIDSDLNGISGEMRAFRQA